MLVLCRKGPRKDTPGDVTTIRYNGEELKIHVRSIVGSLVYLAFDGPQSFQIVREEANHKEPKE